MTLQQPLRALLIALILIVFSAVVISAETASPSTTIAVTTTVDENGAGLGCSLREAVEAADTDAPFGGCPAGSGADTIELQAGATYMLFSQLDVNSDITLSGNGAALDGRNLSRHIVQDRGACTPACPQPPNVVIEDVIFANGRASGNQGGSIYALRGTLKVVRSAFINNLAGTRGGAISAEGSVTLTVEYSSFTNNQITTGGSGFGGAINTSGTLIVTRSTFDNNQVTAAFDSIGGAIYATRSVEIDESLFTSNQVNGGFGGALFLDHKIDLPKLVRNSTFSQNVANQPGNTDSAGGGAIIVGAATGGSAGNKSPVKVFNNTFHANEAYNAGAAIQLAAPGELINNTFVDNSLISTGFQLGVVLISAGSGFYGAGGDVDVTMHNNIITGSIGQDCKAFGNVTVTGSNNLLDDHATTDCGTISAAAVTNLDATLTSNGGATPTVALLTGSNAIDAGGNACPNPSNSNNPLPRDQRGAPRPFDGDNNSTATCDVGAYELQVDTVANINVNDNLTFDNAPNFVIDVTADTDLDCMTVEQFDTDHPQAIGKGAGDGIFTGRYWSINAYQVDCSTPATDFVVILTLPHANVANPKMCRHDSSGDEWFCYNPTSFTSSTATLTGVDGFSDWAIGVGGTVPLVGPNLVLTKSDDVDPVKPGDTFTYTLSILNDGNGAAAGVVLTDTLPAELTPLPVAGFTCVGNPVVCQVGSIAVGETVEVKLPVMVSASASGTFTNTAVVNSAEIDGFPADNTASETTTIAQPDLTLTKTDSADPVTQGDIFTYTLTIINNGTSAASNVLVTDTLPAGLTPLTPTVSLAGNVLRYHFDETSGNAIDSSGNGYDGVVAGATQNVAGQIGSSYAIDGIDDYVLAGGGVVPAFDMDDALSIALWIYPTGPGAGTVAGQGAGVIFDRPGEYYLIRRADGHLYYALNNTTPGWAGFDIGNHAALNTWTHVVLTYDTNASNEQVKMYANGALVYTQAATGSIGDTPQDANKDEVRVGNSQGINWPFDGRIDEVYLFNRAISAEEVTALHSSATGIGSCAGTPLVCNIGALSVGQSATVAIPVVATMTGTFTNTAVVNSAEIDQNPADNSASETTIVKLDAPDLVVTKSDSADPVLQGATVTYTINVSNTGLQPASSIRLTDTLPAVMTPLTPTISLEGNLLRYHFDEVSGDASDTSGNGYAGTLVGSPTQAEAGQIGSSYHFDGSADHVLAGGGVVPEFEMSDALSIAVWIYPTGPGGGDAGGGSGASYGMIMNREGEYSMLRLDSGEILYGVANTTPGWSSITSGVFTPLNTWTHLVLTYDANTSSNQFKLYANGVLADTNAGSGLIGDFSNASALDELRIGSRQGGDQARFDGRIDEVYLYNRAISAEEVTSLYSSVIGVGNCTPMEPVCDLGGLPVGNSATVVLPVKIADDAGGMVTNVVVVNSAEIDANPVDNSISETTTISIPTAIKALVAQSSQTPQGRITLLLLSIMLLSATATCIRRLCHRSTR